MKKRYLSVRWKFISTYLLFSLIMFIILLIVSYIVMENTLIENKKDYYINKAKYISNEVNILLNNENCSKKDVVNYLIKISHSLNFRILIISNVNNTILFDSYNNKIGDVLENFNLNNVKNNYLYIKNQKFGKLLYIFNPIFYNKKNIATIMFSISLKDISRNLIYINKNILIAGFLTLLFLIIIASILANYQTKLIVNLRDKLIDINYYQKYDIKFPIHKKDEISELINQINILLVKINEINTIRNNFVSNVSHELRTPIASMLIISDSLLSNKNTNLEVYQDFMKDINYELKRLSSIVNTLLELVNLEKDDLNLNYYISNVNEILENNIKILKPVAKKKNINFIIDLEKNVLANIDPVKYSQVFINILNNAIKYSYENSKIDIKLYTKDENFYVDIKDYGIGISEDDIDNIFDRFYRIDEARTRNTGGTGLGLSIAKQIINLHLGNILVTSELNRGSLFTIIVPKDFIKRKKYEEK